MRLEIRHGDYRSVLTGISADLILTSPPYNIGSKSPAKTGKRNAKLGTYDPKSYRGIREYSDSLPEDVYQEQQSAFVTWCHDHLNNNGTLVYNHKPRRVRGELIHPMQWLLREKRMVLMEEIIWDRGSTHNHCPQLMWPHTERLYIFRKSDGDYVLNNTEALDFRSDVWRIPKAPVNGHNAPFPEAIARSVIRAYCPPNGLVMDPYAGSGTTALATFQEGKGRRFIGAELIKTYCEQAQKRVNYA